MPINIRKQNEKEYIYFQIGSKKMYIGTLDNPKEEKINEAKHELSLKIKEYEDEIYFLNKLIDNKYNINYDEYEIKYDIIIFDIGGVIYTKPWKDITNNEVTVSVWDLLFKELGIFEMHEKLKKNYLEGVYKDYIEWTNATLNVIKSFGLKKEKFNKVIYENVKFTSNMQKIYDLIKKQNKKFILITGGFYEIINRFNKEIGVVDDAYYHCKLNFNDNGYLDNWDIYETDFHHRSDRVKDVINKYDSSSNKIAYIGDNLNDSETFKNVGMSIAFNPSKLETIKYSNIVIDSNNIMHIYPYLCKLN